MVILKLFGIEPSKVHSLLSTKVEGFQDLKIKYYKGFLETKLEIDKTDNTEFRYALADIMQNLAEYIYATEDITIYERAAEYLKQRNKKITLFEQGSCARLTSNLLAFDDAQNNIDESMTMFTNESIIKHFDVSPKNLSETTKISAKNAYDIATNLLSKSLSDIIIVTLGVLSESNRITPKTLQPQGLAFIAIGDKNNVGVKKYNFTGTQNEIIEAISKTACWNLINKLK